MLNSLDPKLQQDHHSVAPDLGPNCLQSLSADDKVAASKKRVKSTKLFTITPVDFLSYACKKKHKPKVM